MTQAEAEAIAREIRNRCLHSSWSELVAFWQGVMGNLVGAYRVAAQGEAPSRDMPSLHRAQPRPVMRDELESALSQLAGERRLARWRSESTVTVS